MAGLTSGNKDLAQLSGQGPAKTSVYSSENEAMSKLFPALNFLLFLVGIVSVGLSKEKGLLTLTTEQGLTLGLGHCEPRKSHAP